MAPLELSINPLVWSGRSALPAATPSIRVLLLAARCVLFAGITSKGIVDFSELLVSIRSRVFMCARGLDRIDEEIDRSPDRRIGVDFVGANANSEAGAWNLTMFALGLFDTLKIVPVVSNKMTDYGNASCKECRQLIDLGTRILILEAMEGEDTTCRSLLRELQSIWEEMGQSDEERDRMLLQLEQECLDVYRRKVDQANSVRAGLHQLLADSESELASLLLLLGDRPCTLEKRSGTTLREQLLSVSPQLECLRLRKEERLKQFEDVQCQIQRLSLEISPGTLQETENGAFCWKDLLLRKLYETMSTIASFKSFRIKRLRTQLHKFSELLEVLQGYCVLLGTDYTEAVKEVHPSLCDPGQSRSISDETLEKLGKTIGSQDESRFNATRGAHLSLKRAERARVIVAKLPNLLESLKSKTRSWGTKEAGPSYITGYISLLAILEEYSLLRREKEEEKRRLREEKRMQEQLQTEQELLYGTKASKKGQVGLRVSGNNANRRLSIVPELLPAPKASNQGPQKGSRVKRYSPMMNYVALPKDPEAILKIRTISGVYTLLLSRIDADKFHTAGKDQSMAGAGASLLLVLLENSQGCFTKSGYNIFPVAGCKKDTGPPFKDGCGLAFSLNVTDTPDSHSQPVGKCRGVEFFVDNGTIAHLSGHVTSDDLQCTVSFQDGPGA
ncbi:hypothetical protein SELMODRAFT_414176 [Selaginella moellendorffii]|uniref:Uncharacterized protein n=1 Tax=Selaginella moellendorffii TaxID=88036 RepID=D8RRW7_SELML|nr:hypothetical protein SELMODRAFT_414176 [Selaginella moellendorffii]